MSREAVLSIIKSICFSEEYVQFRADYGSNGQRDTAIICIKALPSVTPQPKEEPQQKTGHWIGHREHCEKLGVIPSGLGVYEWCSNCDYGIDIRDWHRISHNYCPKCGAKMQEVKK